MHSTNFYYGQHQAGATGLSVDTRNTQPFRLSPSHQEQQPGAVRRSATMSEGHPGMVRRNATSAEMHAVTAYATPPDVRRVLGGAPHTAGVDGGRRHSQAAEFDSYNGRSIATTLGLESQFSRVNYDDSSMYAHTPGRDAAAHVTGRHSRVNSMVSPSAKARAIEDTRNALAGGARHVAASDSFGWGTPDAIGRTRTGSVASAARLSYQDQGYHARANALALDRPHRASYAGSVAPSVVGSASAYRARAAAAANNNTATASASGASATRRARRHSSQQQPKAGKTPIRSNWYHQDEMLHESELAGQDFASSDEEDFGKDGDYDGNMVAQQRLIENQHRQIFDLGMRNKILEKAMADKCGKPYEALADDLGRTCASNRKANRVIKQLTDDVENLRAHCKMLEDQAAHPPTCRLPHGMSDEERAHMLDLEQKLDVEISVNSQFRAKLDEKDALYRDIVEKLDREVLQSEYWRNSASKYSMELAAVSSPARHQSAATATAELLSSRTRAGTATTMSESVTLRAPSDMSVGGGGVENYAIAPRATAANSLFDMQSKQDLLMTLENLESSGNKLRSEKLVLESQLDKSVAALKQAEADLKHARKKVLDLEEDRRTLQSAMKCSEVNLKAAGGSEKELAKLAAENDELRDRCDALQREVGYANNNLMAAVSNMDLARDTAADDDEDMDGAAGRGLVTLRAENAKLKVECRDLNERHRIAAEYADNLKKELDQAKELSYSFKHDVVRKFIRESTVGPAQAEAVRENYRQWSQLQCIVPDSGSPSRLQRHAQHSLPYRGAFNSAGSSPSLLAQSDDSFVYEQTADASPPPALVPKPMQQQRRPLSTGMFQPN
ncbi:hypothetical protein GGI20_004130 [Coemansia sp. BCRC 34301]|nr:hypothetical protein GGI20_004130 [Coemansia sp. BCRC 34301]